VDESGSGASCATAVYQTETRVSELDLRPLSQPHSPLPLDEDLLNGADDLSRDPARNRPVVVDDDAAMVDSMPIASLSPGAHKVC